jgi:protein-S-isoprenylcysteine O-methyltransferase Ste14
MKVMPTTCLLIAILLCVGLHLLLPIARIVPTPWNLLGIIPLGLGVWINLSADQMFKKAQTTVKPFEESRVLIWEGVFRLSRNPMYLGFVGVLLGIAILLRSVSPYGVVILFAITVYLIYIRVEEQMLAAKFGEEWSAYRLKVRRWI